MRKVRILVVLGAIVFGGITGAMVVPAETQGDTQARAASHFIRCSVLRTRNSAYIAAVWVTRRHHSCLTGNVAANLVWAGYCEGAFERRACRLRYVPTGGRGVWTCRRYATGHYATSLFICTQFLVYSRTQWVAFTVGT